MTTGYSLEHTAGVKGEGPSRRDKLEQTSQAAEDLWLVLPELLPPIEAVLDPV